MSQSPIHIIGAGAFGTALASVWLKAGRDVTLWCRDRAQAQGLAVEGLNSKVPAAPKLNGIKAGTLDDFELTDPSSVVVLAVKARAQASVYAALCPPLPSACQIVTASKGFANEQGALLSEQITPPNGLHILSGPSFADDLFANRPTALTLASEHASPSLSALLSSPLLRIYQSTDPIGVQICGAMKNVIAIACGCSIGLGLGASARSALMTRGLREIERVVTLYGGSVRTASGLAGIGDLALTCQDADSRNYRFGLALGRGDDLSAILAQNITVEGADTARGLRDGSRTSGIDLPISHAVADLIDGKADRTEVITKLLDRALTQDV